MKYGDLPTELGIHQINCKEMMFYQYLPIKLNSSTDIKIEDRLLCFSDIIGKVSCDFIGVFGLNRFVNSYMYLTAKYMYQHGECSYNRHGYHSDGFATDDINYIWSDKNPTVFNFSNFDEMPINDNDSMVYMNAMASHLKEKRYPENTLLRLNQFNIHKVAENQSDGMRTFLKISFSKDKYDLLGNSHNYLLNYDWEMKQRRKERNIPQTVIK